MADVVLHLNTEPAISLDEYRLLTQVQHERRKREQAQHNATQAQIQVTAMRDAAVANLMLAWGTALDVPPTDTEWETKRREFHRLLTRAAHNAVRKDQAP